MRIQKCPDTCGGDLNERLNGLPSSEPLLSGIQEYGRAQQNSLFVSGTSINAKCTNDTCVKARPKRMAAVIFRDTATNYFHEQRRLLALFHVFYTTTLSPPEAFERMRILKRKTVSGRDGFNFDYYSFKVFPRF